jgi:hypothetical protein
MLPGFVAGELRDDLDLDATSALMIAAIRGLSVASGRSARESAAPLATLEKLLGA